VVVHDIRSDRGPPVVHAIPADRDLRPAGAPVVPVVRKSPYEGEIGLQPRITIVPVLSAESADHRGA